MLKLKEIYALPIATPPELQLEPNTIVVDKWRGSDGKTRRRTDTYPNRKYSAQVVTASDTKMLEVTAWSHDNIPLWRTWQTDDRVISQLFVMNKSGEVERKPGTSTVNNLRKWRDKYHTTKETEQTVLKWAQSVIYPYPKEDDTFRLIQYCQETAKHKKRDDERNKIRQQIANEMLDIRPLPKVFETKVLRDAFCDNHYIVYDYQPKAKVVTGYCTRCGNTVSVKTPKNHGIGRCPRCHAAITYKSEKTMARCSCYEHIKNVAYLQTIPGGFCMRTFHARMYVYGDKYKSPKIELYEMERRFYNFTQDYETQVFHWGEIWPNEPHGWHREYSSIGYNGYIYPDNLKKLFANTKWKYIPMVDIARHCHKLDFSRFIKLTVADKAIEHLAKHKLWELTQGRINNIHQGWGIGREREPSECAKNIKEALSVENMAQVKEILVLNPDCRQLELYKALLPLKLNNKATIRQIITSNYSLKDIEILLKHTTFHRLHRYVTEQISLCDKETETEWHGYRRVAKKRDKRPDEVLHLWRDYIEDCKKLKFDLRDDFIMYPKYLEQAHHDTIAALEDMRNPTQSIAIEAAKHEKSYLEFSTNGYMIVLPKSAGEIVVEGKLLHHCVGGYVDRVANGETLIFFIRTISEPEKPFCTLELSPKTLKRIQVRADRNADPPEAVMKFLQKWEKHLDKLKKKASQTRLKVAV